MGITLKYKASCVDLNNNLIDKPMKELIKKINLHTINVEGDFIISEERLETFAKMYHKEQLALYSVVSSNKVDYKQGFELAQKYIEESPCDPDIYRTQLDAWNDYQQFLIDNNIT